MSRTKHHGHKAKERNGLTEHWAGNEPKWWRRLMKHKKRRVSARAAEKQVERGNVDVTFPHDKKPWVYYW